MKRIWISLLTIVLLVLSQNEGACVGTLFIEHNAMTISLVSAQDAFGEIGKDYVFEVFQHATQTRREFTIHADTNAPTELKIYKNNLILIGALNHGGESITRVNLQTGLVENQIGAYFPVFSPDNRFVVYIAHFPRHLPQNATSTDIVKVYDFDKTPQENRVAPQFTDISYCGIPVFPEEDAKTSNERNIVYNDKRPVYKVVPRFLWLKDSRKIVCLVNDQTFGEYANFLVLIDLENGVHHPYIVRKRIDSSLSLDFRDGITDPIAVKELAEDGENIVITTHRNYGPRPAGIDPQTEKVSEQRIRLPKSIFE